MTVINVYSPNDRAVAEAYAAEIGGYVSEGYNEHGWIAVNHDDAEGKHVPYWSSIPIPDGFVLTRRIEVRPGDEVVSSHSGRRTVASASWMGTDPDNSTTYLWLEGSPSPEAYPSDSLLPTMRARHEAPRPAADTTDTTTEEAGAMSESTPAPKPEQASYDNPPISVASNAGTMRLTVWTDILEGESIEIRLDPGQALALAAEVASLAGRTAKYAANALAMGDCSTCRNTRLVNREHPGGRVERVHCPDCSEGGPGSDFPPFPRVGGGIR